MAIVKNLLDSKSVGKNYTIDRKDSMLNALKMMSEANIGAVLVTEGEKIVGIVTERDYARKGEYTGKTASDTKVQDLMTEKMMTVNTSTSVDECMALMKEYGCRHLPVVEKDKLIGMVSMRDVVYTLLSDRESTIKGLENYISGSGFAT